MLFSRSIRDVWSSWLFRQDCFFGSRSREFLFFKTSTGAREWEISKCGCWISSSTTYHTLLHYLSFQLFSYLVSRTIFAHLGLRNSLLRFRDSCTIAAWLSSHRSSFAPTIHPGNVIIQRCLTHCNLSFRECWVIVARIEVSENWRWGDYERRGGWRLWLRELGLLEGWVWRFLGGLKQSWKSHWELSQSYWMFAGLNQG
jgi:hypothetical protein